MRVVGQLKDCVCELTAANSRPMTLLIVLPMLAVIMAASVFLIALLSYRGEKGFVGSQELILDSSGIEFSGRDAKGQTPCSTCEYYLESRWSFFVWHPKGPFGSCFRSRSCQSVRSALGSDLSKIKPGAVALVLLLARSFKNARLHSGVRSSLGQTFFLSHLAWSD